MKGSTFMRVKEDFTPFKNPNGVPDAASVGEWIGAMLLTHTNTCVRFTAPQFAFTGRPYRSVYGSANNHHSIPAPLPPLMDEEGQPIFMNLPPGAVLPPHLLQQPPPQQQQHLAQQPPYPIPSYPNLPPPQQQPHPSAPHYRQHVSR